MKEIHGEAQMEDFAREVAEKLVAGKAGEGACVVGLSGELGSGKTAFMKAFARVLGIEQTVISPTFVLEQVYDVPKGSPLAGHFERVVHIDAYRLEGAEDLGALGWDDISANPENLIFIEWPEMVKEALPADMISIRFEHADQETRRVSW